MFKKPLPLFEKNYLSSALPHFDKSLIKKEKGSGNGHLKTFQMIYRSKKG